MYKEIIDFAKENNLVSEKNRRTCVIAGYINITSDGKFELLEGITKKDRKVVSVPDFGSHARNEKYANFVVEKLQNILDVNLKKHNDYVSEIAVGADTCESLCAIHKFMNIFHSDNSLQDKIMNQIKEQSLNGSDNISWKIDGRPVEGMIDDWNDWLIERVKYFKANKADNPMIISSFSGELQESVPAADGPAIGNIFDNKVKASFGVARACHVVAAKQASYQSYGFDKALGCQVGVEDAEALVAGFEALFNSDSYHNNDFNMIYFYKGDVENIIDESMNYKSNDNDDADENEEDEIEYDESENDSLMSQILHAVFDKKPLSVDDESLKKVQYYMCKFQTPAGRYFLSDEIVGTCYDLVMNLYKWYDDTQIITYTGKKSIFNFYSILLSCLTNKNAKDIKKAVKDEFGSSKVLLLYSIYQNEQIPVVYYARALRDASKTFVRKCDKDGNVLETPSNIKPIYVQIIKCYLIRKGYEIMPEMTSNVSVGYACGKLFAIYEQLQYRYHYEKSEASEKDGKKKKLNTTLAQNYFSVAMRRPGVAFAAISDMQSVYLNGLSSDASKVYYTRMIADVMSEIGMVFPKALSTDEQGAFTIGYYQQKSVFLQKKPKSSSDGSAKAGTESTDVKPSDTDTENN